MLSIKIRELLKEGKIDEAIIEIAEEIEELQDQLKNMDDHNES